jgi:uncharacterized protein YhaN
MDEVKKQIDDIDGQIETEIQKVRERLADFQQSKKSLQQVYKGMAKLLGLDSELDDEEAEAASSAMPKM